jgi:acyl-CoA synthetase (AMP-forming)/AMP-acid ligase II
MPREGGMNTIRDVIDCMAQVRPDLAFLIGPETNDALTFKGFRDGVRRLRQRLHGMGFEPGDKIAFLMDNGLFTAQLFLGTMYGGFVIVPLNARAGVDQLAFTLEECDARVVFVGEPYGDLIHDVLSRVRRPVEVVLANADVSILGSEVAVTTEALSPLGADDVAMLMYTSGSTGKPKGTIHTHRSVLAHGRNSIQAHKLTDADRSLLVLPLYHINAECVTLVPTLMSGGSVVVPHGFAVREFWDWVDDYQCTWSAVVPTIIAQLLDWKDPKPGSRAAALQRIRFMRSSSAPLSPSLHQEFIDKFGIPLIQAMGSSEAGNVFSNPAPPGRNKIGSPGLPWGFDLKIIGTDGAELPAGEPGEVLLRGDAMMQGYYKDPEGTKAVLDAEGWLHTGDLAYRDDDGYVFVMGRLKELVIKGGVNIAPKQIDEVLETHPAVLEAAAVGVPDRHFGEDLVAFVVLRADASCDQRTMLSFCESHLGYFKTPTRIHFVADLPKGPSGKVQRLRLVDVAKSLEAAGTPTGEETSEALGRSDAVQKTSSADGRRLEPLITEIWADILAVSHIDPDSNFFALGGQSLQAIQCLSRLRDRTSLILSLSDFFANPTVLQLAAVVQRRMDSASAPGGATGVNACTDMQPIPRRDQTLPCPLSLAQERIWFMEQIKSGEPTYNEAEAVRLKGTLDVDVLEPAFNAVVARHEILRSTIQTTDGRPLTTVHASWLVKFKRINLTNLPAAQREAELEQLLINEPREPYELATEPGIRITVVKMGADDHALILMMHHIVCDSASVGILWREFATAYEASLQGTTLRMPPLPIQYGDYAVWLRDPAQQARFDEDLAFWQENLRGAPTLLDQPTDRSRPAVCSFRGNKRLFEFDAVLASELRRLCRQQRASLFTVFAAGFTAVMHRYTGQDDILLGVPTADRERPELRPLIGFLLDTHVLRAELSGDPTFRELMARVQRGVADLYSHRAVPFDQVVAALRPDRNPSYSPMFQVMLNWRDRDDQPQFIGLSGLVTEPLLAQPKTAKFDLTLVLTDEGDKIYIEVEYSTDLFDEHRIERLVGHLQTLLEGAATDVEQRLSELPLLTSDEQRQLLLEWAVEQADEDVYP